MDYQLAGTVMLLGYNSHTSIPSARGLSACFKCGNRYSVILANLLTRVQKLENKKILSTAADVLLRKNTANCLAAKANWVARVLRPFHQDDVGHTSLIRMKFVFICLLYSNSIYADANPPRRSESASY